MIGLVRLEADGSTLDEVVKDIDAATKALKLSKEMHVHDEHYERVREGLYKGRRVFKLGLPGVVTNPTVQTSWPRQTYWGTLNTASSASASPVVKKAA